MMWYVGYLQVLNPRESLWSSITSLCNARCLVDQGGWEASTYKFVKNLISHFQMINLCGEVSQSTTSNGSKSMHVYKIYNDISSSLHRSKHANFKQAFPKRLHWYAYINIDIDIPLERILHGLGHENVFCAQRCNKPTANATAASLVSL